MQVFSLPDFTPLIAFGQDELREPYGLWVRKHDGALLGDLWVGTLDWPRVRWDRLFDPAAADAAAAAFGRWSGPFFTGLSVFVILSILNASVMIPARVLFGLSREGYFLAAARRVNSGGTPYVALLLCYALALVATVTNTFEQMFALGAVILVLVTGGVFASLMRLRVKEPDLPRPYRAWGYPDVPAFALLVSGCCWWALPPATRAAC